MIAATFHESEETRSVLTQALYNVHGANMRLERWVSDARFTEHGKRRVVRYDLEVREAGLSRLQKYRWVGKYYEREENALLVASVLRIIKRSETARTAGLVVPTVLSYHSPHHLLLLTFESGESLTTAISKETRSILTTVGHALGALHGMQIAPPMVASTTTVLADLKPRVEDLSSWLPRDEFRLRREFARLEDEAPTSPPHIGFVHNDFGPANLLWRPGELVVLDFDKCAQGDPALDLGNFLVQLRRRAILHPEKLPNFPAARRALLETYSDWCHSDRRLEDRVAWYERAILLKKGHRLWLEGKNQGSEDGARHIADARRLLGVFLQESLQQVRGPLSADENPSLSIDSKTLRGGVHRSW